MKDKNTKFRFRKFIIRGILGLILLCLGAAAVSALSNTGLPEQSQEPDRLSDEQKALMIEALQLRQALGEQAWPGYGEANIPVIVYNEAFAFLVGYPEPPSGWLKVPQNEPRGGAWEVAPGDSLDGQTYYRTFITDPNQTPEAFTVIVGEQWVGSLATKEWLEISLREAFKRDFPPFVSAILPYRVVIPLFIRGSDGYISALQHESFHAFQGMDAPERLAASERAQARFESAYPWEEESLRQNWQDELDLLADALMATNAAETSVLAQHFLDLRQARRREAVLSYELIEFERQREWLEGLARYIELETWRLAGADPAYSPVQQMSEIRDFNNYQTFERRWAGEIDQMRRMANQPGEGRFYYSGMALAFLLDRLSPGWKARAMEADIWLETLLSEAVQ